MVGSPRKRGNNKEPPGGTPADGGIQPYITFFRFCDRKHRRGRDGLSNLIAAAFFQNSTANGTISAK